MIHTLDIGNHTIEFDDQSGRLIIIGKDDQRITLTAQEVQPLFDMLYQHRGALHRLTHLHGSETTNE